MIEDMTVRNMSPATQRSYVSAVSKFSRHFGKSPERLDLEDVRAFQVHLVSTGISWPGLNQIVCALRFFYGITLGEANVPERIPYAREPRKLPVVLSADEVVLFLESVSSLKSRAALTTAYAAGLRASEVAGLRVADIDSARGVILVRHGKGAKDRNVMLSARLLGILRAYWRLARPTIYLFPGRDEEHAIDPTVLHAACRSAVNAAGLTKRVTLHTLRQLMPQSALPEVSGGRARTMAGRSAGRTVAGSLFPRCVHAARADRGHRLPEQGRRLCDPVQDRH
jgi:integrase